MSAALLSGCLFTMDQEQIEPDVDASTDAGGGSDASAPDADPPPVDPCDGVTCNGAGVCAVPADTAGDFVCVCEVGYQGDDCGECERGFERVNDRCQPFSSPCLDFPCLGGSMCDDAQGVPVCVCPDGTPLEAGGECPRPNPCDGPRGECPSNRICVDDGDEPLCVEPPRTCADVTEYLQGFVDGDATLYVNGDIDQPWGVYCHLDPESRALTEYLTLPADGPRDNLFEEHRYNKQTRYDRVRIDPLTFVVDATDATYAVTSGLLGTPAANPPSIYFGSAGSCGEGDVGSGDPRGLGRINLEGTPFSVEIGTSPEDVFLTGGTCGEGSAEIMRRAQVVDLEATGECGFIAPRRFSLNRGDNCPDADLAREGEDRGSIVSPLPLRYDPSLLDPPPPGD